MKKYHFPILAAAMLDFFGWSVAHAAQFTGTVTQSNGTTPIAGIDVALYKYDPRKGEFVYSSSTVTNPAGAFVAVPSGDPAIHPGSYYITFGYSRGYFSQGTPFLHWSNFYQQHSPDIYYKEIYNNVTILTPGRAPTIIAINTPTQSIPLNLVKLDKKTSSCDIIGPIKINNVPYSSFSVYGGNGGPKLPATGGTLEISFDVLNSGATSIQTSVQPLAFLEKPNDTPLRSVATFTSKAVTIPANTTTTVALNITIPAKFMTATPKDSYNSSPAAWAFNMGINAVSGGLANCFPMPVFPILHDDSSATLQHLTRESLQENLTKKEELVQESPQKNIPLILSEDGNPVKWGPIPSLDQ
ncbi:exported hypothetical protein [Gammaproteobacteria bacterium]